MGAKQGVQAKKPAMYTLRYIEHFFTKHDEVAALYRWLGPLRPIVVSTDETRG